MSVSVSSLVMGPGVLYSGAFGATEPADTAVATVPSSGVWTDVGGTMGGVELTIDQKFKELEVDQVVDIPGQRLVSRTMMLKTSMAEPTLENLSFSSNASASITTGTGFKALEPSNTNSATQPTYRALIFDGFAPGGGNRRVIARRCLNTSGVKFAYKKDSQTVFDVEFTAHFVSASIPAYKIVDAV